MKKALALFLALLLLGGACTALGEVDIWAKYEQPVVVSIGRGGTSTTYAKEGDTFEKNAYIDWIRETYNIDVQYAFTPLSDYDQRVSIAISSGDLPDLMQVNNQTQLNMLLGSGMVADMTDALQTYASPLVNDIIDSYGGFDKAFEKLTVDGRVYALRGFAPSYQYNLSWVRRDWLDAVGAEVPTTLEELEALLVLFKEAQLGGEGTTVPLELHNNVAGSYGGTAMVDPIFGSYGAYVKQWIEGEDGKLIYGSVQPECRDALALLADWYKKGLIDPEFATKDVTASISAGNSGFLFAAWWATTAGMNACKNNVPGAVWECVTCILSPQGQYNVYTSNPEKQWLVVRADYEHPEVAVKLMNLNADITTLAREPITAYETVRPEEIRAIDINPASKWILWPYPLETQFNNAQLLISKALVKGVDENALEGFPENSKNEIAMIQQYIRGEVDTVEAWNSWGRYTGRKQMVLVDDVLHVEDSHFPMATESMTLFWDSLQTLESNTYKKIIMGELPLEAFDEFVANWYAQGGRDIVEEVNAQFGR